MAPSLAKLVLALLGEIERIAREFQSHLCFVYDVFCASAAAPGSVCQVQGKCALQWRARFVCALPTLCGQTPAPGFYGTRRQHGLCALRLARKVSPRAREGMQHQMPRTHPLVHCHPCEKAALCITSGITGCAAARPSALRTLQQ